jgi:hypothetical protein
MRINVIFSKSVFAFLCVNRQNENVTMLKIEESNPRLSKLFLFSCSFTGSKQVSQGFHFFAQHAYFALESVNS